jgi:signal transduction histidine kinase
LVGGVIALSLQRFEIHLEASYLMLAVSLGYCVLHYMINAYILYQFVNTVRLKNAEIEEQRAEIREKSEELTVLNESLLRVNAGLETNVRDRTQELEIKNKKLEEYIFMNAHKLRAPVATVLGLIQLFDQKYEVDAENIIEKLRATGTELDRAISDIRKMLEEDEKYLGNGM